MSTKLLAVDTANNLYSQITVGSGLSVSAGTITAGAGGGGTVTSVAMTAPGIFSVAGSPVTTAGTLAVTLATQAANLVWAGPVSGGALAPAFRSLVSADLPAIAYGSLTGLPTLGTAAATATGDYDAAGVAAAGDAAHVVAGDPHTQYALESALATVATTGLYSSLTSIPTTFAPIIGSGGTQAVAGNDARLTDARAPLTHAAAHQNNGADEISVAGLSGVLADPQPPIIGSGAAQAVAGNDARLTDSRTPLAHATSHKSGGSDSIKLDELAAPTDVTTLNASTSAHGLMMKYPGGTTNFLRADGSFAAPTAAAHASSHQDGGADELALDASQVTTGVFGIARLATGTPNGSKFIRDDNTLQAVTASLPDLVQTRLDTNGDQTVTAGYGSYIPYGYEIGASNTLEIGASSVLEVG